MGATALDQTETELAYQNQQLSKIETPDGAKTFSTTDEKNNPIYTLSTDGHGDAHGNVPDVYVAGAR